MSLTRSRYRGDDKNFYATRERNTAWYCHNVPAPHEAPRFGRLATRGLTPVKKAFGIS